MKNGLKTITSQLEDLRERKTERKNQFVEAVDQLEKISREICVPLEDSLYKMVVEETDLSLRRLEELRRRLVEYQNEKVFILLVLFKIVVLGLESCGCRKKLLACSYE